MLSYIQSWLQQPDGFPPSPSAAMDGCYTRVLTPHGTLILIICDVRKATNGRPGMVHVSWTPHTQGGPVSPYAWRADAFVPSPLLSNLHLRPKPPNAPLQPFKLEAPDIGSLEMTKEGDSTHSFDLDLVPTGEMKMAGSSPPLIRARVLLETTARVPWTAGGGNETLGPEGWIGRLGRLLPLHWLVHSRASEARWQIEPVDQGGLEEMSKKEKEARGMVGQGVAHIEKNWGTSFPPSWIWLHATPTPPVSTPLTPPSFTFGMAGGLLPSFFSFLPPLPVEAYLAGLRVPAHGIAWDFRPPWTLRTLGASAWTTIERFAEEGRVRIELVNWCWRRKVVVESHGEATSFLPLSCPLAEGHSLPSQGYALESFSARTRICAYTRQWPFFGAWRQIWSGDAEAGALEFGGAWTDGLKGWQK